MIKFFREIQTKFDNFVKNNKTLMMIILCWSVLIFYLCLKIFFGYYIEFATRNENFIMFCNFIDANIYVNYILSCSISYVMFYYYYCALLGKQKLDKKELIILLVMILVTNILCNINMLLSFLCDIIKALIVPLIFMKKVTIKNILNCIIMYIVNVFFQAISLFSRNLQLDKSIQDSSFVSLLLYLDVLIMIYIYYQYRKNGKEFKIMTWLGKWFGKSPKNLLLKKKEKKLNKINTLNKDIQNIENELNKYENK